MENKIAIKLLQGKVGHARFWPKKNTFSYPVFYTSIPITEKMNYPKALFLSFNRWNLFSIHSEDYGKRIPNSSLYTFIVTELKNAEFPFNSENTIHMISHPRVLGYAFNPITHWLVTDNENLLLAVFCEVHNTFGETHNYLLMKKGHSPINPDDTFIAEKFLYVSPFNKLEGHYEFNFSYSPEYFKSFINYFENSKKKILLAYMECHATDLSSWNILYSLVAYPFMTIGIIVHIHWQALILFLKGIKPTLDTRPKQYTNYRTTVSTRLK